MQVQLSEKLTNELNKLGIKCLSSEEHAESVQEDHEEDSFGMVLTYEDGTVLESIVFYQLDENRIEIPSGQGGIVIDLNKGEAENAVEIRNFLYTIGEEAGAHLNPQNV